MTYINALPTSLSTVFNLADRVATCTTAAADRAIATYRWLTQPQAIAKYKWLGAMTLAMIELTCVCLEWLAIHAWLRFAKPESEFIVDLTPAYKAQVTSAIADMTDAELEAEFNDSFEVLVTIDPPAQAQSMTSPIATLRLAPSTSHEDALDRKFELVGLTIKQLVPIAAALSLPTRKKKADLIDSILAAEGYQN